MLTIPNTSKVITWIYNFSFSATNGPLSWIVPAEIFDTRTRSKGVSIATMTSFAFNTMIGQVTPIALEKIGYKFYYLFVRHNSSCPMVKHELTERRSCATSQMLYSFGLYSLRLRRDLSKK